MSSAVKYSGSNNNTITPDPSLQTNSSIELGSRRTKGNQNHLAQHIGDHRHRKFSDIDSGGETDSSIELGTRKKSNTKKYERTAKLEIETNIHNISNFNPSLEIDTNIYRYFLVPENSLLTRFKYLGLFVDTNVELHTIKGSKLYNHITNQFSNIKKYIRDLLKYIYIIKNDKTLLTNVKHEYIYLSKYIKDYNMKGIKTIDENEVVFKNWNFLTSFLKEKLGKFK